MKIAIISDSHDNIPNIEKFLLWAKENKIETIIHCGDIAAPRVVKEVFEPQFAGEMHLVHGNVSDRDVLYEVCDEIKKFTLHGDEGELEVDEIKMAFCHFPEKANELAESNKYDVVFYGHTHKPWIEKVGNAQIVNPGTLAGLFSKATFSVYDTKTKELKLKLLEKL
jgi:uncharacterized protein